MATFALWVVGIVASTAIRIGDALATAVTADPAAATEVLHALVRALGAESPARIVGTESTRPVIASPSTFIEPVTPPPTFTQAISFIETWQDCDATPAKRP